MTNEKTIKKRENKQPLKNWPQKTEAVLNAEL